MGVEMSGGSFRYAYSRVDQFADELGIRLDEHDRKNQYGDTPYDFSAAVLFKLREIEALARYTAKMMKEAEWLYSFDTGEDSFMRNVREIESSNDRAQGRASGASPAAKS